MIFSTEPDPYEESTKRRKQGKLKKKRRKERRKRGKKERRREGGKDNGVGKEAGEGRRKR